MKLTMVSFPSLVATGLAMLATSAFSAPTTANINSITRAESSTVCGTEPSPGIRKPENGQKITYTSEEQKNFDGTTFEIIYCSGDYFKTASLNATALITPGNTTGPGTSGMILGSATPDGAAAAPGFYGYIFNVTVYPQNGNYLTGPQQLSIFESETGYYNANNYQLHTVTIDLEKAPTDSW